MERMLVSVEDVLWGDLLLEAKADDTHHVYVDRVNSTYADDGWQIVMTDMGYSRYSHGQIVTILRGYKA